MYLFYFIHLGNTKQWTVDERYPACTLRDAFKYYLDITTPLTQNMLLYCNFEFNKLFQKKLKIYRAFYFQIQGFKLIL